LGFLGDNRRQKESGAEAPLISQQVVLVVLAFAQDQPKHEVEVQVPGGVSPLSEGKSTNIGEVRTSENSIAKPDSIIIGPDTTTRVSEGS
jgi:hypothetical protein